MSSRHAVRVFNDFILKKRETEYLAVGVFLAYFLFPPIPPHVWMLLEEYDLSLPGFNMPFDVEWRHVTESILDGAKQWSTNRDFKVGWDLKAQGLEAVSVILLTLTTLQELSFPTPNLLSLPVLNASRNKKYPVILIPGIVSTVSPAHPISRSRCLLLIVQRRNRVSSPGPHPQRTRTTFESDCGGRPR